MPGQRKPMADNVERIRQLAGEGWTAARIAHRLKLDVHTIYSYASLNEIVITKAPNPYHQERNKVRAEIAEYARQNPGLTRVAIANHFGVAGPTVHRALKDAGLPTTRQYDAEGNLIDRPPQDA